MNINISYLTDLDEVPKEIAENLISMRDKMDDMGEELENLAKDLVRSDGDIHEIMRLMDEIESKKEKVEDYKKYLASYENCLMSFVQISKERNDKEEVMDQMGPDALEIRDYNNEPDIEEPDLEDE